MLKHCCCLSLLWLALAGRWAAAQVLPFSRPLVRDTASCLLPTGYRVSFSLTNSPYGPARLLHHTVLDARQRPVSQRVLPVGPRGTRLVGFGFNPRAALYHLQWMHPLDELSSDSTLLVVVDTTGRVLSQRRQALASYQRPAEMPLVVGTDSLLVSCLLDDDLAKFSLQCVDLRLRSRWSLPFPAHRHSVRLIGFVADAAYAWVLVADDFISRQATCTAYCVELATGRLAATQPFDYQTEKRIPTGVLLLPDHALFVTGWSYRDGRVRWRPEKRFTVTLPAESPAPPPRTP